MKSLLHRKIIPKLIIPTLMTNSTTFLWLESLVSGGQWGIQDLQDLLAQRENLEETDLTDYLAYRAHLEMF